MVDFHLKKSISESTSFLGIEIECFEKFDENRLLKHLQRRKTIFEQGKWAKIDLTLSFQSGKPIQKLKNDPSEDIRFSKSENRPLLT